MESKYSQRRNSVEFIIVLCYRFVVIYGGHFKNAQQAGKTILVIYFEEKKSV